MPIGIRKEVIPMPIEESNWKLLDTGLSNLLQIKINVMITYRIMKNAISKQI